MSKKNPEVSKSEWVRFYQMFDDTRVALGWKILSLGEPEKATIKIDVTEG